MYLPLCKEADTPFQLQGGELCFRLYFVLPCGYFFTTFFLLLYADYIVLLAGDLQLQLDVLNQWCHKWRMTINQTKS